MALELFSNLQINLLFDIAVIIVFATIIAFIIRLFKQPLILGYILAGVVLGPSFLGLIKNEEIIFALSEIGIAFLLFFIGLEMDLKKLKQVGFFASLGTIIQVVLTFIAAFFISTYLGLNSMTATILGFIVAFSSTSVVVKLLSDKEQIDTLHGRLALGLLLMQDIIVIFLLSVISTSDHFSAMALVSSFIKGILLFGIALFMSGKVFPKLFEAAAAHKEMILLLALTTCFLFSTMAAYFGFSIAVGAFIAGISIAPLRYSLNIQGMVSPLKDFFATIFFVSLGLQLRFGGFVDNMLPIFGALILLVVVGKPLLILIIALLFGYEKRAASLTALSLGQVSEFSLIIAALALNLGMIGRDIFSLTILLVVASIVTTTYISKTENKIYSKLSWFFNAISFIVPAVKVQKKVRVKKKDVVLFGAHRMGEIFLETFQKMKKKVLVVDYNPDIIRALEKRGVTCIYGDIANEEILKAAKLGDVKFVVSTVRTEEDNLQMINFMKENNNKAKIIVVAEHIYQALELYDAGADYVIVPHIVSGEKATVLMKDLLKGSKKVEKIKKDHIKHILYMERFDRPYK
jgi:Kef-type K+ transport system membrane component KefB/ActR/RegA family two-component response regulator